MKPDRVQKICDALAPHFVRCSNLDEALRLHVQPAPSLEDLAQLLRGARRTTPSGIGKTPNPGDRRTQ